MLSRPTTPLPSTLHERTNREAHGNLLAALLAAATVAACGSSTSSTSSTSTMSSAAASSPATSHNAADVMFTQTMIPHHEQAIVMAELAATRAGSPTVKVGSPPGSGLRRPRRSPR